MPLTLKTEQIQHVHRTLMIKNHVHIIITVRVCTKSLACTSVCLKPSEPKCECGLTVLSASQNTLTKSTTMLYYDPCPSLTVISGGTDVFKSLHDCFSGNSFQLASWLIIASYTLVCIVIIVANTVIFHVY